MKKSQILVVVLAAAVAPLIVLSPPEDSVAYMVAILCAGLAMLGMLLVRDDGERRILIRLFAAAYILRLVFTVICYKANILDVFGAGDAYMWRQAWDLSRIWSGWPVGTYDFGFPQTLGELYSGRSNMGYSYFSTWLYYGLNVRSQMTLSFINCFINSLTVVMVYQSARLFFSQKASTFAALMALILPGFIIWSALTIKETWIIFFEITAFYATWRFARDRNPLYALLVIAMAALVLAFRFYATWCLLGAAVLTVISANTARPLRTALCCTVGLFAVMVVLNVLLLVPFDLMSIALSRLDDMTDFREAISGAGSRAGGAGVRSGVQLDYDIRTPGGAAMMILVGSTYVLFSPFPWNLFSARQVLALPDVVLWYALVFIFILPGIRYAWQQHKHVLVSVAAFVLPLLLLYSMIFGNVGLAYRQRAQLMPFLLLLAAAGYERRLQHARVPSAQTRFSPLRGRLQRRRGALPQSILSRP